MPGQSSSKSSLLVDAPSTQEIFPVRVLVVDNQPENLLSLEAVIASPGLQVVSVRSGSEALKALLDNDFALILLDVQMPVMDGFETAEIIRRRERSRHTPIIFVTAINKDAQHMFRGYALGAVDYVFKPFLPEVLRSKVEVFAEMHRKSLELEKRARTAEQAGYQLEVFERAMLYDALALLNRASGNNDTLELRELRGFLEEIEKAGAAVLVQRKTSLSSLCKDSVEAFRNAEGLTVSWEIGELPSIYCDEDLMRSTFKHLTVVSAGLVSGSDKPAVEVTSFFEEDGTAVLSWRAKDQVAEFEGPVGSLDLLRIFESREVYENLGLHMAVIEKIAYRHGATVSIVAKNGRGTNILLKIPAQPGESDIGGDFGSITEGGNRR